MKGHPFINVFSDHTYCSANNVGNSLEVKTHPDPTTTVLASDSLIFYRNKEGSWLKMLHFSHIIFLFLQSLSNSWKVLLYS